MACYTFHCYLVAVDKDWNIFLNEDEAAKKKSAKKIQFECTPLLNTKWNPIHKGTHSLGNFLSASKEWNRFIFAFFLRKHSTIQKCFSTNGNKKKITQYAAAEGRTTEWNVAISIQLCVLVDLYYFVSLQDFFFIKNMLIYAGQQNLRQTTTLCSDCGYMVKHSFKFKERECSIWWEIEMAGGYITPFKIDSSQSI